MRRRDLLAVGGTSVIGSVSGCIDGGLGSDSEADDEPEEREFPEHPGTLEPEAVKRFVDEYEEVYHHNDHLDHPSYQGAHCVTEIARSTEDVVYTITGCHFDEVGRTYRGHSPFTDAGMVLYTVTPDDARRVGVVKDRQVRDTYEATDGMTEADANYGIWIGSFDQPYEISIEVSHQMDAGQVEVFEETLTNFDGKHFTHVTEVEGTYEIRVSKADGSVLTETVEVPNEKPHPGRNQKMLAAFVITVEGDLVQWDIEFPRIYGR